MSILKKHIAAVFLAIVCIFSITLPVRAVFVEHENWREVSMAALNKKFNAGDSFIAVLYHADCENSRLRADRVSAWLSDYPGVTVYGVNMTTLPERSFWVTENLGSDEQLPVVCMVTDQDNYAVFPAGVSWRKIQLALGNYLGVYEQDTENFYEANQAFYAGYSVDPGYAAGFLPARPELLETAVLAAAQTLTDVFAGDYAYLRAILGWLADNLIYDYSPIDDRPDERSAGDILAHKVTDSAGFARVTAALCQAAGIPCRVVDGYALDRPDTAFTGLRAVYQKYLTDGDLSVFQTLVGPNHTWVEAFADGRWVTLDPAWDTGNESYSDGRTIQNPAGDAYFDPSIADFSATHLLRAAYAPGAPNVPDLVLDADALGLAEGDSNQLSVKGTLSDAGVVWYSSDESVVTVSQTGGVTAQTKGTAEIYASGLVGGAYKTAVCSVSVARLSAAELAQAYVRTAQAYHGRTGEQLAESALGITRSAWCAEFVSATAQAYRLGGYIPFSPGCTGLYTRTTGNGTGATGYYLDERANEAFMAGSAGTRSVAVSRGDWAGTPKAGDLIFFRWNKDCADCSDYNRSCHTEGMFSHAGIVQSVSGSNVTVVHGNYGDQVSIDTFNIYEHVCVVAFVRPNYIAAAAARGG